MRAVQFAEQGPPEVLRVVDVPEPHAGPGQVRIVVRASGVNPVDWKIRSGASRGAPVALPHVPGLDAAGVVDEVGEGVSDLAVGDEVFGATETGALAERALLRHAARKPAAMSWEEAGSLPSAVETALRAIDLLGVVRGEVLLVDGAAGGVGTAAVQLAVARGATVVGTASAAGHDHLRALGAVPTTYGPGLVGRVRALVPDGVDRALDVAGAGSLADLVELTGSAERVITVADPTAAAHGVRFTAGVERRYWEAFALVADLAARGAFTMPVQAVFPLADAAAAHRLSEGGHVRGKIVVAVG